MVSRGESISSRGLKTRKAATDTVASQAPARQATHHSALISLTVMMLLVLGLVMILSASSVSSFATYGSSFQFFNKQLMWAAIGVVSFIAFSNIDYKRLKGWGYPAFCGSFLLLVAVMIPGVGVSVGGSVRWIGIGPLTFQPSELAKLAFVLFAADVLARKKERNLRSFSHTVVPLIPAMGVLAVLVMAQPDLGTTILLGAIGLGMLFVAGTPLRYIALIGSSGAILATAAAFSADYRRARILAFLNPWADPLNTGYQTIQSLIALGSGGWFGVGLGASRQKWSYIPNSHTDFIFAILGEEMGIFGTLVVVGMFAFLAYLGIRTAAKAPDRFGMLLASGITVWITVQALVNIGAVTASLPITGVPLPFVSFGGSSLVLTLISAGILVNISRQARTPTAKKK